MPASQEHINSHTPLGANLIADGATFRVWAPDAKKIYICGDFNDWARDASTELVNASGYWGGFVGGVKEGNHYKFYVKGEGSEGYKRDPYARELSENPAYPLSNCIVRSPDSYPWHDHGYHPPAFNDLIIYQFHFGTFYGPDRNNRVARFLDFIDRLDYLIALGVNAIEPLPVTEYASPRSLGYDGSDLFSPEMDYNLDDGELAPYLDKINAILARSGHNGLTRKQLAVPVNQLKAVIDICHLHGIAVILDHVYNHAGGQITGQDESIYFFDRKAGVNPEDSLYFTSQRHTGPVFAFWQKEVRQFLIDNACFFVNEYHIDGIRYDQVSVIVKQNENDGWSFCQNLSDTVRYIDPSVFQCAEYWNVDPWITRQSREGGAGFDGCWHDGLREAIRGAVAQASGGRDAPVELDRVARNLIHDGFAASWQTVQYIESHDEVYVERAPRVAALADPGDHRSWYARSRARVASGILLTSPCVPMLFMGQEFLEDKNWSDNPGNDPNTLIWWKGLEEGDKTMADYLRFMQELIGLRRRQPALRGEGINVFHVHNGNRIIAFHRWVEGQGKDIVVVASLNEGTFYDYRIGYPKRGKWTEVFNSDIYDNWVNPLGVGNGGAITADGAPMHGLPASSGIVIPANGLLVFAAEE